MHTAINELLGIEKPILLAPMGHVSGGALAAAVSRASGLGLIGAGYRDADWIRREFDNAGGERVGEGFERSSNDQLAFFQRHLKA